MPGRHNAGPKRDPGVVACLRCGRLLFSPDVRRVRLCRRCRVRNAKLGPRAEPVQTRGDACDVLRSLDRSDFD